MQHVVSITFADAAAAAQGAARLAELGRRERGVTVGAVARVDRSEGGAPRLEEIDGDVAAHPAAAGAGLGAIVGAIGGPGAAAAGGLAGALVGGAVAAADANRRDFLLEVVGDEVPPGHVAVVALVHEDSRAPLDEAFAGTGARVRRWLPQDIEADLRAAELAVERGIRVERRPSVAVVTGASAGVGRATVVALARRGMTVGLLARGRAGLDGAARDVEAAGGTAIVCPTDVADAAAVEAAAAQVEDEAGPIDIWVNNAMTTVFAPSWEVRPEEFRRTTEVTYLGQVHGTLSALSRMRPRDRGVIVNVGSALAYRAIPLQSAYCAAKFAGRGFSEAVRSELLHEGSNVRLTMVHLPAVNTPQFGWCLNRLPKHPQPVPPVYAPQEAAAAIVAAALDPPRAKILGGFNSLLVVANKIAPGVVDHYVAKTGVASQQTDRDVEPDRPFGLWEPVDDTEDHGARGIFGDLEGGMRRPKYWASVPKQVVDVLEATVRRAGEVVADRRGSFGRIDARSARR